MRRSPTRLSQMNQRCLMTPTSRPNTRTELWRSNNRRRSSKEERTWYSVTTVLATTRVQSVPDLASIAPFSMKTYVIDLQQHRPSTLTSWAKQAGSRRSTNSSIETGTMSTCTASRARMLNRTGKTSYWLDAGSETAILMITMNTTPTKGSNMT